MKKISIWWAAHTTSIPYWKVKYKDGSNTYFIPYSEAKGLSRLFNGQMYIDYKEIIKRFR